MTDDLPRRRVMPPRRSRQRIELHLLIADLKHLAVDHPPPDQRLDNIPDRDRLDPHHNMIATIPDETRPGTLFP